MNKKPKTTKPEITVKRWNTATGKLSYYKDSKLVTAVGTGGHIMLPKELIGKKVVVIFEEESK